MGSIKKRKVSKQKGKKQPAMVRRALLDFRTNEDLRYLLMRSRSANQAMAEKFVKVSGILASAAELVKRMAWEVEHGRGDYGRHGE